MQAPNQVVMLAREPKVRLITTLIATETTEESTKKSTMLQRAHAIHKMAIVMQALLMAISMKTMGFSSLMM